MGVSSKLVYSKYILLSVIFFLLNQRGCTKDLTFGPQNENFYDLMVNKERGMLVVRGKSTLYEIASDLRQVSSASAVAATDKSKYVLLDLPDSDQLIICNNSGKCEIRNSSNIVDIIRTMDFKNCEDENRITTFVGIAAQIKMKEKMVPFFGSSYCGLENAFISARDTTMLTDNNHKAISFYNLELERRDPVIDDALPKKYKIYFKSAVTHFNFIYFLTNQPFSANVGNKEFVSKIIKICKYSEPENSDTGSERVLYEDVPFSCYSGEKEYKLLQHAALLELSENDELSSLCGDSSNCTLLIGIFANGTNPEQPESSSAVCVFTIKQILEHFSTSRADNLLKPNTPFDGGYMKKSQYLDGISLELYKSDNLEDVNYCNDDLLRNVIGNITLNGIACYDTEDMLFTKIEASVTNGFVHVFVGTHSGQVVQLYIPPAQKKAEVINTHEFGEKIIVVRSLNNHIYAMTESKLVRLDNVDCSTYKTCNRCIASWNPHCGWCILTQKCTEYGTECPKYSEPYFWLKAPQQKCLVMDLKPEGIYKGIASLSVELHLTPNILQDSDLFSCKYDSDRNTFSGNICSVGPLSAHGSSMLSLIATFEGNKIVVAEAPFMTYNCSKFNTCKDCVGRYEKGIQCFWCKESATCAVNSNVCTVDNSSHVMNEEECPALIPDQKLSIPLHDKRNVTVSGSKIPVQSPSDFQCDVGGRPFDVAEVNTDNITCRSVVVQSSSNKGENNLAVTIKYKSKVLGSTMITVYDCQKLADDCSTCRFHKMNKGYECEWCHPGQGKRNCLYKNSNRCITIEDCPPPSISKISPINATVDGGTEVEIEGKNFGIGIESIQSIALAGVPCTNLKDFNLRASIKCTTGRNVAGSGKVAMTVNRKDASPVTSESDFDFKYEQPDPRNISPNQIIKDGGVNLTISGNNLNIGQRIYTVTLQHNDSNSNLRNMSCDPTNITQDHKNILCLAEEFKCGTEENCGTKIHEINKILITFDGGPPKELNANFTYEKSPIFSGLQPNRSFDSGGRNITIKGDYFRYVQLPKMNDVPCDKKSNKEIICGSPSKNKTGQRRKRDTSNGDVTKITIKLDGKTFTDSITYYDNPKFKQLDENVEIDPDNLQNLRIEGERMNVAASFRDYIVLIKHRKCDVVKLNETFLECNPEPNPPGTEEKFMVTVRVGNYEEVVGHVRYKAVLNIMVIIVGLLGGVLVIVVVVAIIVVRRMKKNKEKAVEEIWMEVRQTEDKIKKTMQEEFATLQTTIEDIKQNVVSTGMPYFYFERYAFNQLFPKEDFEEHSLMKSPSISVDIEKAMQDLERLINNKYFIKSIIFTLDKQKKFTLQDKAQFASMLSILFVGKMDYFLEVVKLLLESLIVNVQKRQQKALFRRAESISNRLLSDYLSLAVYPHLKESGCGAHLFMLYKATQTLIEKCPVDAITGESEVTLSQDKLLKEMIHAETLDLSVVLNDGKQNYPCKVLDCDTITQVKSKCIYDIYKNKPASEIPKVDDVDLEWHAGRSGKLVLYDISGSNEQEEVYVRLNTMKDYCVTTGSEMALIGKCLDDDDIYENTGKHVDPHQVQIDMNPDTVQWHLVKPTREDDVSKNRNAMTTMPEIYLNRLLRTKLALKEYIEEMFKKVIDAENLPKALLYLFTLMEKHGSDNDVDTETIQVWKSDIYVNRIWATLITRPEILFDIQKASHVEPSLDVIKQALIDSFSHIPHRLGKNSPTQKLLFAAEVKTCQDRVQAMFKSINTGSYDVDDTEMRKLMKEFSDKYGQTLGFNKYSVLQHLFQYIRTYVDDILSDLDQNEETGELKLGEKLDSVMEMMDQGGFGQLNGMNGRAQANEYV